ncbi:MAG: sirohydrochlorin cobaltochelatase [Clostridium sp.]|nr:sirohydrochlorin cobaltochelatase [Clostridium sp.]
MRKTAKTLMTAVLAMTTASMLLAGCGGSQPAPTEAPAEAEDTAAEAPEAAPEILVVSFGTSYNSSRSITIGGIESTIRETFPEYTQRRAFTAQTIIDKLKDRDGVEIDNVEEALDRAAAEGVKTLIVQPTHLMDGFEYTDLKEALEGYQDKFDKIALADPLLTSDEDYSAVADAMAAVTAKYDDGETAIVFMGHGTEAESNKDYAQMQEVLAAKGYENYYIGTVEATPSVDDVLAAVQEKGTYKKVVLRPMMVVAGDHATNDMAGDEDDSWKTIFENAGFEVTCVLEGLGQEYEIQKIYADHTQKAIDSLN